MEKIAAKQVEGVVDTTNAQEVSGLKTFLSGASFQGTSPSDFAGMHMNGLHIYWLKNLGNLEEEGNFRLGVNTSSGLFSFQHFAFGQWEDL